MAIEWPHPVFRMLVGICGLLLAWPSVGAPIYHFQETLPANGAVAVSDTHIVIGLVQGFEDDGWIITYQRHGRFWVESQRIPGGLQAQFGALTRFWDDTLIIAAPWGTRAGDPEKHGQVYLYEHDGNSWQGEIVAGGQAFEELGSRIATAGDTMVIGSPRFSGDPGNWVEGRGRVYVFNRTPEGVPFHSFLQQSNVPNEWDSWDFGDWEPVPGYDEGDSFGWAVAMSGDRVLVTAPLENSSATGVGGDPDNEEATNSGAAYFYELQGDEWVETTYLKPTNTTAGYQFGRSAAMSGNRLAIGDLANIHTYTHNGQEWELRQMLPSRYDPVMNGDTMLIGADLYSFDSASGEWTLCQTLPVAPRGSALFAGTELYKDGKISPPIRYRMCSSMQPARPVVTARPGRTPSAICKTPLPPWRRAPV